MFPITFNPLWPVLWIVLLGLAALGGTVWAYLGSESGASRRMKVVLLLLRCAALAVALLCLLRPSIRRVKVYEEKAKLVVLLDSSESMTVCDGANGMSRVAEMNAGVQEQQSRMDELYARFDVSVLQFGSDVRAARLGQTLAQDPSTALGDALTASLAEAQGKRLAAVLVLSDGSHNTGIGPQAASHVCMQQRVKVVAVGFGRATGTVAVKDVKVRSLKCARTVYVRNILNVEAELLCLGCDGEVAEVSLLFDDKPVDKKSIEVSGARATCPVEFQYAPPETGTYKVKVVAGAMKHEIVTANNEAASFVRVLPGGFNVLYLEGRPRPEYKFLKRCFQAAAGMEVTAPLVFMFQGKPVGRQIPQSSQEWRQYDLIILGDISCDAFGTSQLQDIHDAVAKKGTGLLMIGGVRNFGSGGYANTPVGQMLPVSQSGAETQRDAKFLLTPTPEGYEHFALRLDRDASKSRDAWRALPPLEGAIEFGPARPGATVLATDGKGTPVLVAQPYGKGRTMAFAADTTWRWVLSESDTEAHYKRFWRQIALWLAGREDKGGDLVFLSLSDVRYAKGQKVRIRAIVEDKEGSPISDANVTATVISPSGTEIPLALRYDDVRYRALYFPTETGDYHIRLDASRRDKPIGADHGRFLVYERNMELDEPEADLVVLRSLAEATQGAYFPSHQLDAALDFAAGLKSEAKVKTTETQDIWDNPLAFYVFVMLLCLEWVLRKVLGLV